MPEISEADLQSLNEAKAQLPQLQDAVKKLQDEQENLKTAKDVLERKLDDADRELLSEDYLNFKGKKGKSTTGGDDDDTPDDFDFDRASNADLVKHVRTMSKLELENALAGVTKRMEESENKMGKAFAQIDVALTAMRHTDFESNKDAIYKIAQANPSWSAEKCYKQWQMEKKQADDAKTAADRKKAEDERKALTEKGEGVAGSAMKGKKLSAEEAASLAYDQSFGNSERA